MKGPNKHIQPLNSGLSDQTPYLNLGVVLDHSASKAGSYLKLARIYFWIGLAGLSWIISIIWNKIKWTTPAYWSTLSNVLLFYKKRREYVKQLGFSLLHWVQIPSKSNSRLKLFSWMFWVPVNLDFRFIKIYSQTRNAQHFIKRKRSLIMVEIFDIISNRVRVSCLDNWHL